MTTQQHSALTRHFLSHQRLWAPGLLLLWAISNVLVLATTIILEHGRDGNQLSFWQPFCWEITSIFMVLLLIPCVVYISDKWLTDLSLKKQILAHLLLTIPFSAIHVGGMVALRKLWYWVVGTRYTFGDIPYELLYEYRKDFYSYVVIAAFIFSYRFIVRRLHGEASLVGEGEQEANPEEKQPERFLVKKLGKEFLVNVNDIEWIEAAGNYANLHIGSSLYPMRTTMTKLEQALPVAKFARIHRSAIVNFNQVKTLRPLESGDYELILLDGTRLSLSRRYRNAFKALV